MEGLHDIHCHIVYDVDDGARSFEESVSMLKEAAANGISSMIATPHFRYEMFEYPKEKIDERFEQLKESGMGLGIEIFPGSEYHVNSDIIRDLREARAHTLADTKYVLCEFSHDSDIEEINNYTRMLLSNGYSPVIAHIERYGALQKNIKGCLLLREMGAMLQVNADSILGFDSYILKKISNRFLKEGIVDIVASDAHGVGFRNNHLPECYRYVCKKYSKEYADTMFITNPQMITNQAKKKQERAVNNAE